MQTIKKNRKAQETEFILFVCAFFAFGAFMLFVGQEDIDANVLGSNQSELNDPHHITFTNGTLCDFDDDGLWTGLVDTVQCAVDSAGHFLNIVQTDSGFRALTIIFLVLACIVGWIIITKVIRGS